MSELSFGQSSRRFLESLREHPHAPRYNFESTDMLDQKRLAQVRDFERDQAGAVFWGPGELPHWMPDFLAHTYRTVPYYRAMGSPPRDFSTVPTIGRGELAEHPELLVPDNRSLGELTVYTTSGTTGSSLKIPTDPAVASKVLVLMDRLLSPFGLRLPRGGGQVAVASLFFQNETLTYPGLSHYLDGAAGVKINLNPDCWRKESDRAEFLRQIRPAVVTGCPLSLKVLSEIAPDLRPAAMMSSAVHLSEGLRKSLEECFDCPVFDVYSLTEAKFIACRVNGDVHHLICPDTYVEILDPEGRMSPPGEVGEITLTGGRNLYLPLVRYRTGDFAALEFSGRQPVLRDFQGRGPVELRDAEGKSIPSLDIVHALKDFPLVGFSFQLHGTEFVLAYCGEVEPGELEAVLARLMGFAGRAVRKASWEGKPHQFPGNPWAVPARNH